MPIDYYEKMESGGVYHVYNRTNNKELAFKTAFVDELCQGNQ
jgi:hypothetical protein